MTLKSAILLVLLIGAGFLGNYFTLPLFFGADFLFGSIAVLLVLYFYGLGWGLLAALAAYSYTWVLWGHPYGFINFMIEALVVGLFLKRGYRNLVLLDSLFWLPLGMGLVWIEHSQILQMDAISTAFIMLKQAINGIFNALLVSLAIYYLPLGKLFPRPQLATEFSLRDSLFSLLVMLALLPTMLLTMLGTRQEKENLQTEVIANLQSLSANLQFHLHSWFQQHGQAVQELAALAGISSMTPTAPLQHETEILKQAFPNFRALHVENALGRTIAFAPKINEKGQSTIGLDFSERSWFQEAKAKQQLVVSEVFQGSAAIFSPIVLFNVPIMRENQWLGMASGVLDLGMLRKMLQPYSLGKPMIITLTDLQGKIIASTAPERTPMQSWDRQKTGVSQPLNGGMYHWHPDDQKLPSMTRWRRSFYVQETSLGPELPWKLTIEAPVAPMQDALYSLYVKNLAIMAGLTVLALVFSLLLSRWLTRPLIQLSQVTANLPEKLSEARNLDWPASSALEINSLIAHAKSMAHTLEENFHNLQSQADELRQVNRELHREIQERQQAEAELGRSLSLQNATLESTNDGLLVVDRSGYYSSYNQKFAQMWRIPNEVLASRKRDEVLAFVLPQLKHPEGFFARVQELYGDPEAEGYDLIEFQDGRIFERFSQPQRLEGEVVGRVWSFRDVTERNQAEEALRASEAKYRTLVENIPQKIFVKDKNSVYLSCNENFARDNGLSSGEVVGRTDFDFFPQELADKYRADDRRVMESGKTESIEERYPQQGKEIWVQTIKTPIRGEDGRVAGVLGIFWDITERRQAKQALEEEAIRRRILVEQSRDGIVVLDQTGKVYEANQRYAEMLGYSPEEVRELYVWDWDAQWTREELLVQLRLVDAAGDHFETRHRRKDGTVFDVEISTNGAVLGGKKLVFCVCRDISQRKAAELALRESEEKYRLVFDKAPVGIMHYDRTSAVTDCNEKFAEIIGAPKEKFIGFNMMRQLLDDKLREAVAASLHGETGHYEGDYVSVTAGKLTPVRAIFQPIFSPDGPLLGGVTIFEDVTERKQAAQERLRLGKLESLGVLAGGIAHDFNNILMVILGSISLASLAPSVSEAQERLAAAEGACGQGQNLARQLLTFAKGGAPIKKPQDLKTIIQEAARLALSGSQARVELSLPERLWEAEVDRGQMHQVFSNLFINADQAMPTGGLIRVEARNVESADAIRFSLPPGKYVAVTLADQGVGIAPGHLERIFDPYFTTKQKGSGIGLAAVHSIVTQHGGRITVDSQLGRGTAFHLYLPAIEGKVQDEARLKTRLPKGNGRILVMDDEPLVREVVGKMLRALGYEPVLAREGREALELCAQGQTVGEPFAAVILDLTIPGGMGGLEALQRLRAQAPQVKAIVSSGYGDDSIMADFKSHGFLGVIAKPYRLEELAKVLKEVLNP